jgi:DNA-binding winged helix-turn-helix (wHTH) protein
LVEPVMPRTAVTSPTAIRMHFGSFELNVAERSLRNADEVIPLGGRAFDILLTLIERNGEVVTKDELIKKVWPEVTVEEGSLRVHLSALRKALGDGRFGNRYIVNVKGRGYSFVAPVTRQFSGSGDRRLGTSTAREPDSEGFSAGKQPFQLSDEARTNNFPMAVTDLIGRAAAARLLRDLVSAYRVVALTGPGGIGKSTLAIEVGRGILGDFQGGGWLVDLASLADEDLVPSTVASRYPIAGPPKDKRRVAIDDVARDTEPRRLRDDVVKGAKGAAKYVGPVGLRSRADIVERDLLLAGILPCHSLFAG